MKGFAKMFELAVLSWLVAERYRLASNPITARRLETDIWSEKRPYVSLEELVYNLPNEVVAGATSQKQILNLLVKMRNKGLLSNDSPYPDQTSRFFITPQGVLVVRQTWQPLVNLINENEPEEVATKIEGKKATPKIKQFIAELKEKFKDRTQEEVVGAVIDGAKNYGGPLFVSFLKWALGG
jgi:hypothetical protein